VTRRHRRLQDVCVRWANARAAAVQEILIHADEEEAHLGAFGSNSWVEELAARRLLGPTVRWLKNAARKRRKEAGRLRLASEPLVAWPRTALWLIV